MNSQQLEFLGHIRKTHFALVTVCFALAVASSLQPKDVLDRAREQLKQVDRLFATLDPDSLEVALFEFRDTEADSITPCFNDINLVFVDSPKWPIPDVAAIGVPADHVSCNWDTWERFDWLQATGRMDEGLEVLYSGIKERRDLTRAFQEDDPHRPDHDSEPKTLERFVERWQLWLQQLPVVARIDLLNWPDVSGRWGDRKFNAQLWPSQGLSVAVSDTIVVQVVSVESRRDRELALSVVFYAKDGTWVEVSVAAPSDEVHGATEFSVVQIKSHSFLPEIVWGLDIRSSDFDRAFPELAAVAKDLESLSLTQLEDYLDRLLSSDERYVEIFGAAIPLRGVSRWGIVLIMALQLYFLLHLQHMPTMNEGFPWVCVYDDRVSFVVALATSVALPVAVIFRLYWVARHTIGVPERIIVILAIGLSSVLSRVTWDVLARSKRNLA